MYNKKKNWVLPNLKLVWQFLGWVLTTFIKDHILYVIMMVTFFILLKDCPLSKGDHQKHKNAPIFTETSVEIWEQIKRVTLRATFKNKLTLLFVKETHSFHLYYAQLFKNWTCTFARITIPLVNLSILWTGLLHNHLDQEMCIWENKGNKKNIK